MRCPFCSRDDSQVKDSRPAEEGSAIRRRRACSNCGARFTTFERIQLREMTVLKSNDKHQPFDREKLLRSMQIALRKRPVDPEEIEKSANLIVRQLETIGEPEVDSKHIGQLVMNSLAKLDSVAFIRYASVYKDFCDAEDFNNFVRKVSTFSEKQGVAAE